MVRSELAQPPCTKQAILAATYDIARTKGIDHLSAGAIARQTGISKGGFFHHFPQVDDLYLYILDELMASLRQSASAHTHPTFTDFIDDMANSLLDMYRASPETIPMLLHFFSLCQQRPAYLDRLRTTSAELFSSWSGRLDAYADSGTTDGALDGALDEVTRLTDMFFLGFGIHNLLFGEPETYRRLAHHFGEMAETYYFRNQ